MIYQQKDFIRSQEREAERHGRIIDETNPVDLLFPKLILKKKNSIDPGVYKLHAVITHDGESPDTGKYTAYVSGQSTDILFESI
jgi:hypothetical protein